VSPIFVDLKPLVFEDIVREPNEEQKEELRSDRSHSLSSGSSVSKELSLSQEDLEDEEEEQK